MVPLVCRASTSYCTLSTFILPTPFSADTEIDETTSSACPFWPKICAPLTPITTCNSSPSYFSYSIAQFSNQHNCSVNTRCTKKGTFSSAHSIKQALIIFCCSCLSSRGQAPEPVSPVQPHGSVEQSVTRFSVLRHTVLLVMLMQITLVA